MRRRLRFGGVIDDPAASPLAVAAVLDGRRLYPRRADLEAVVAVDDRVRTDTLAATVRQEAAEREIAEHADPLGCSRRDVEKAMAAAARVADGQPLSDVELAQLGCALTDVRVRDTLYALAVGENSGPAESLWAVLARALPEPWRVEALVLLAFSAYARGDGPLAGRCPWRPRCAARQGIGWPACSTRRYSRGFGRSISGNSRPPAIGWLGNSACGYRRDGRSAHPANPADVRGNQTFSTLTACAIAWGRVTFSCPGMTMVTPPPGLVSTVTRAFGTTPASLSRVIKSMSP